MGVATPPKFHMVFWAKSRPDISDFADSVTGPSSFCDIWSWGLPPPEALDIVDFVVLKRPFFSLRINGNDFKCKQLAKMIYDLLQFRLVEDFHSKEFSDPRSTA
jgi:hypothetical protein